MPIYEYECPRCGSFEHSQSIHDRPLHKCPKCRRKVQRLISSTSFQLKGGGWYAQGYEKGGGSGSKSSDGKAATATKTSTTTEKPAAAPATTTDSSSS